MSRFCPRRLLLYILKNGTEDKDKDVRRKVKRYCQKKKKKKCEEMEVQGQQNKSSVVKVDSAQKWDYYVSQSKDQGCPVSFLLFLCFFNARDTGMC